MVPGLFGRGPSLRESSSGPHPSVRWLRCGVVC